MTSLPHHEPRVTVEVVQGLFDCFAPLSEALAARSRALGFDPQLLEPTYPVKAFSELVVAGATERASGLPLDEALEQLGQQTVRAMQARHRWLAALLPMMWLVGPHRMLAKANARRIGQTDTEVLYTELGPTEGELVMRPCPLPRFHAGVISQVVANAGVQQVRVAVQRSSEVEAVFNVRWAPR